ncbi:MAG: hypothetical protein CL908_21105 [Deltaproteobacteria bacterium]|nr:hypothetical protein [Deltaproteobacteria bacterium]
MSREDGSASRHADASGFSRHAVETNRGGTKMKATMKATILVAALILVPVTAAQADNDVGCGVGTMIWEGNTGLAYKILASSTNGLTF